VAQAAVGVHGAPWTQVLQIPWAEQVRPAPQGKPGAWSNRSVQTATPLEHSNVALAVHGLEEVQVAPWVQETQAPV
jgi:hypothetical protein